MAVQWIIGQVQGSIGGDPFSGHKDDLPFDVEELFVEQCESILLDLSLRYNTSIDCTGSLEKILQKDLRDLVS